MRSFKLWKALATAAVAAAILPGGVALSNYSGPYAKHKILRPPYNYIDERGGASCLPAHECGYFGDGNPNTGEIISQAFVRTPALGLAPGALSSADGISSLKIVDHFPAGTTDNAMYRVFLKIDEVLHQTPLLATNSGAFGAITVTARPQNCGCMGYGFAPLFFKEHHPLVIDVVVPGAFHGDVNISVDLDSYAYLGVGAGEILSFHRVHVTKVERIW